MFFFVAAMSRQTPYIWCHWNHLKSPRRFHFWLVVDLYTPLKNDGVKVRLEKIISTKMGKIKKSCSSHHQSAIAFDTLHWLHLANLIYANHIPQNSPKTHPEWWTSERNRTWEWLQVAWNRLVSRNPERGRHVSHNGRGWTTLIDWGLPSGYLT